MEKLSNKYQELFNNPACLICDKISVFKVVVFTMY